MVFLHLLYNSWDCENNVANILHGVRNEITTGTSETCTLEHVNYVVPVEKYENMT
jgi:hypothetical protein